MGTLTIVSEGYVQRHIYKTVSAIEQSHNVQSLGEACKHDLYITFTRISIASVTIPLSKKGRVV